MKMKDRRKSVHSFSGLLSSLSIENWFKVYIAWELLGNRALKKSFEDMRSIGT